MKRPTSVTVIGWIWLVMGVLMLLSSMMALFMFLAVLRPHLQEMPLPAEEGGLPWAADLFLRNAGILFGLQATLAVYVVIAARCFLRLRSWARTSLEVISWFGLAWIVGFSIFFCVTFIGTFASGEVQGAPPFVFIAIGVPVMVLVIAAMQGVPLAVIIRFLRGETIRRAVRGEWEEKVAVLGETRSGPSQGGVPKGTGKRPTSVSVIGWLWIGIAILALLANGGALVFHLIEEQPVSQDMPAADADERGSRQEADLLFRHMPIIASFMVALAVYTVVAASYFLKLRSWARTSLEAVSWVGLVLLVASSVYHIVLFRNRFGMFGSVSESVVPVVVVVMSLVYYGVPLAVIIRFLRGETIRRAMNGGGVKKDED